MSDIKMLFHCIFNDGVSFVEKYTYFPMCQLVNSLISGLILLCSDEVVLFQKSR